MQCHFPEQNEIHFFLRQGCGVQGCFLTRLEAEWRNLEYVNSVNVAWLRNAFPWHLKSPCLLFLKRCSGGTGTSAEVGE